MQDCCPFLLSLGGNAIGDALAGAPCLTPRSYSSCTGACRMVWLANLPLLHCAHGSVPDAPSTTIVQDVMVGGIPSLLDRPQIPVSTQFNAPPGLNAPPRSRCLAPELTQLVLAQSIMGLVKSILLCKRPIAPTLQDFHFRMLLNAAKPNWSNDEFVERSNGKVIASDPNSIKAYG
jgi:hypothetical protein